ncbi:hypothetical protein [Nocardioides nitrophenolicus]|uniref:hypothetical protein n=1 Tax=Nocardioides nitrophenolicus TaxID=60489 RepID=UPI00195B22E1|nr:hypothetical protein [Nocardioides nitrophenolicus]MBM7519737.1 hypothetical protein [Nocardioides nitrophenolicus]
MKDVLSREMAAERVRATLAAVAGGITEPAVDAGLAAAEERARARRSRRRRRLLVGAGVLVAPVALTAGAVLRQGPEYVDTIPAERIVTSGEVDGSRYLLVESDRVDACGQPVRGVELVEERKNLLGSEWSTTGYTYGAYVDTACGTVVDPASYLADPARYDDSGAEVGDSFVWVFSVHPDVDGVRIEAGERTTTLPVHEVDGAGYSVFEIPDDLESYTSTLLIDGQVVPGSARPQPVPRR